MNITRVLRHIQADTRCKEVLYSTLLFKKNIFISLSGYPKSSFTSHFLQNPFVFNLGTFKKICYDKIKNGIKLTWSIYINQQPRTWCRDDVGDWTSPRLMADTRTSLGRGEGRRFKQLISYLN